MFTAADVIGAHSKVKSGADFPKYIQEIKALGVKNYEVFVADGKSIYYGDSGHKAEVAPKYAAQQIATQVDKTTFTEQLKAHQQGKTDYLTFIKMCAETGIEKWEIVMDAITCTYFDQHGNQILTENIPQ